MLISIIILDRTHNWDLSLGSDLLSNVSRIDLIYSISNTSLYYQLNFIINSLRKYQWLDEFDYHLAISNIRWTRSIHDIYSNRS